MEWLIYFFFLLFLYPSEMQNVFFCAHFFFVSQSERGFTMILATLVTWSPRHFTRHFFFFFRVTKHERLRSYQLLLFFFFFFCFFSFPFLFSPRKHYHRILLRHDAGLLHPFERYAQHQMSIDVVLVDTTGREVR